jgi:hypothetical protein
VIVVDQSEKTGWSVITGVFRRCTAVALMFVHILSLARKVIQSL